MPDIGRVRVVFDGFKGGPGVATHYFSVDGSTSWADQKQPIADGIIGAYATIQELFPAAMTITVQDEIDILEEEDGEIVTTVVVDGGTLNGSGTGGFGPIAAGMAVTWLTAGVVAGRHVKGRTYLVPMDVSTVQVDGSPTSEALDACAEYGSTLIAVDGGNADLVVWSRPRRAVIDGPITTVGSHHKVLSADVADKFAVLRSRRD